MLLTGAFALTSLLIRRATVDGGLGGGIVTHRSRTPLANHCHNHRQGSSAHSIDSLTTNPKIRRTTLSKTVDVFLKVRISLARLMRRWETVLVARKGGKGLSG
jgi:hypothetical protein